MSTVAIAPQAKDVAQKYSKMKAEEQYNDLPESDKQALKDKAKEALGKQGLNPTDAAITNQIINQLVQKNGIGNMGDSFSKGVDVVTSIITGLITGDITGGLAGASEPYLAEQGNSVLAGASGAITGEAVADYIREALYGKGTKVEDLTQAQKDNISALSQIASGLAVAAGGGSVSDVGTAVAGSKNSVENNNLAPAIPIIQQSLASLFGIQNPNKENNEQFALSLEQAFKNAGIAIVDGFEALSPDQKVTYLGEIAKELTPAEKEKIQYQVKLDTERNQIAMGNRPKVDNMNDYLSNNEMGQLLKGRTELLGYDPSGNPVYKATSGAGNFINADDQLKLSGNKDALLVYDKTGKCIAALNLDGTRNDTLTAIYKGGNLSAITNTGDKTSQSHQTTIPIDPNDKPKLEGTPIPDQTKPTTTETPIKEQDKDAGKLVTPIIDKDKNEGTYAGPEVNVGDWKDNVLTAEKPYEPNKGSVGNMGEFLGQSGFGSDVKDNSTKTNRQYQGQSIYTADKPIGDLIQKGDQFYLDGSHKNHIEVFDKRGNFKGVLNLDGTKNDAKTDAGQGRKLPK